MISSLRQLSMACENWAHEWGCQQITKYPPKKMEYCIKSNPNWATIQSMYSIFALSMFPSDEDFFSCMCDMRLVRGNLSWLPHKMLASVLTYETCYRCLWIPCNNKIINSPTFYLNRWRIQWLQQFGNFITSCSQIFR